MLLAPRAAGPQLLGLSCWHPASHAQGRCDGERSAGKNHVPSAPMALLRHVRQNIGARSTFALFIAVHASLLSPWLNGCITRPARLSARVGYLADPTERIRGQHQFASGKLRMQNRGVDGGIKACRAATPRRNSREVEAVERLHPEACPAQPNPTATHRRIVVGCEPQPPRRTEKASCTTLPRVFWSACC